MTPVPALVATLALLPLSPVPPTPAPPSVARVAGCRVFPADNYWNTPIGHLPVHPRSRQWLSHMHPGTLLHPDFGPSFGSRPVPYGIPVTVVGGQHRQVRVHFHYAAESDRVRYPLGQDTRIEGGRRSDGDRHAVVVDRSRCRLYETYATYHRRTGLASRVRCHLGPRQQPAAPERLGLR